MRSFETHATRKRYVALCTATGTLAGASTGALFDAATHTRTRNADITGKPVVGSLLVDAPICRLGLGLGLRFGLGLANPNPNP